MRAAPLVGPAAPAKSHSRWRDETCIHLDRQSPKAQDGVQRRLMAASDRNMTPSRVGLTSLQRYEPLFGGTALRPACDDRTREFKVGNSRRQDTPRRRQPHVAASKLDALNTNRSSNSNSFVAAILVLTSLLLTPVAAVQVAFQNCLPDSYRLNSPPPLQWTPLYADARFEARQDSYNLVLTVWANVSGAQDSGNLPPPSSPYWSNDNDTNGKIVEEPDPDAANVLATTLYRKVTVLTYEPWNEAVNFCVDGLTNFTCPLGPVFNTSDIQIPYGLPSSNLSHDFYSTYAFTSFSATLLVINGNAAATNIGCVSATITPDLGDLKWLLKFLPLFVLILTGAAVAFASIFSPWGTMDVFHWTSNYGRDTDLLRLVTPGFGDCLQYLQFIVLTGSLTLSYPGFYQPIVSQVGWSALMFNQSFVSSGPPWQSVVDGIYVTNGTYGLTNMGQLIGMPKSDDIWASMMVWLCVILFSVSLLTLAGLLTHWLYRTISKTPEEDLRAKNIPFFFGNVVRIVISLFFMPVVSLSFFQFVVARTSPSYTVALAAVTVAVLVGSAGWLLWVIIRTRPKSVLFDDLSTVLLYGPLYNTYSDEVASFALIPVLLTFIRGVTIGAVQPSGVAQVVLLAICEVIQILTIHAFRPFPSHTSMNAYHTLFCALRLITILLMVAFVPDLGVTDGPKGWIGYAILLVHAAVLVLLFFLNALQVFVEVIARMLGAGQDDMLGLTRGGLSKIFGMRQLSRRATPRPGPSRASQLSTTRMLDEEGSKMGNAMPSARVRSESAASMGAVAAHHRHRSSSALDSVDLNSAMHRNMDSASSYAPGTPGGETGTFSFLSSPQLARQGAQGVSIEAADPYYRPPRRRRETLNESLHSETQRGSLALDPRSHGGGGGGGGGGQKAEPTEVAGDISRGPTPAPAGNTTANPPNRPDYSTREVDFYYGVRGPALNSDGPGRKLGTGPADPTGPVATATGWFRNLFGGNGKEKGKGFEVVRSSRMPPAMMTRDGGFGDETPPEGIPVAMGVLRNGPIDSDDDDEEPRVRKSSRNRKDNLLAGSGEPNLSDPESPTEECSDQPFRDEPETAPETAAAGSPLASPTIPRKSSKRHSALVERPHTPTLNAYHSVPQDSPDQTTHPSPRRPESGNWLSALPFERSASQKRLSSASSMDFPGDLAQIALYDAGQGRPASMGTVPHHEISRIESQVDTRESAAILVDSEGAAKKTP